MEQESWKIDFYKAMLSETIAYAEIDMETGKLYAAGGIWELYREECSRRKESFLQVIGRHIRENVAPEDTERCFRYFDDAFIRALYFFGIPTQKYSFRRMVDGELRWVELVIHVFQERVTQKVYALLYLKDIDTRMKREIAHEFAANTDPLTHVYNRRMFEQLLHHFMCQGNDPRSGTLLLLDIDNFKTINDCYGHMEGDDALIRLAETLKATFRSKDVIGRLGGDEFLVFIRDVTEREILDCQLEELLLKLHQDGKIPVSCSVGVTFVGRENFSYERCLKEADLALYQSKRLGKNRVCYYEDMGK